MHTVYTLYDSVLLLAPLFPEDVQQGQKVINDMITCLYKPNGDHT